MTTTTNPPAIPGREQTIEQLAPRMTETRTALLHAVAAGSVHWHRPPGNSVSSSVWDRGRTGLPRGEKRMKTVTGEVNWLRSHGLAQLGQNLNAPATIKAVVITARGIALLESLPSANA